MTTRSSLLRRPGVEISQLILFFFSPHIFLQHVNFHFQTFPTVPRPFYTFSKRVSTFPLYIKKNSSPCCTSTTDKKLPGGTFHNNFFIHSIFTLWCYLFFSLLFYLFLFSLCPPIHFLPFSLDAYSLIAVRSWLFTLTARKLRFPFTKKYPECFWHSYFSRENDWHKKKFFFAFFWGYFAGNFLIQLL